jgi:hypothetical protein
MPSCQGCVEVTGRGRQINHHKPNSDTKNSRPVVTVVMFQALKQASTALLATIGNEQSSAEQNDWGITIHFLFLITGFHVLRVVANSTAANAGIEPWFDYICGVNSTKIVRESSILNSRFRITVILTFLAQQCNLQHNRSYPSPSRSILQKARVPEVTSNSGILMKDVYVQPTEELGLSLRWCPLSSSGKVWHVLDVHPSSPAEIAGFIPFSDFIIGSPEGTLSAGESALGELVEEVTRQLYVYINPSFSDDRYDYGCIIRLMM